MRPEAHELIFEARREDFSRPSTEQILQEVGLSPEEVANLLDRVDRDGEAKPRSSPAGLAAGALEYRTGLIVLHLVRQFRRGPRCGRGRW